jgi:hypothetical protein
VFDAADTTKILIQYLESSNSLDGDPTNPGMTGVGSDVGIGNAEICSVTAQFLKKSSDSVRIYLCNSG